jgi:type IV secretory pathway TrbD component
MSSDDKYEKIWEIPIHRSLVQPQYWMGVPRNILILEVVLAILGGVIFKTFSVLVLMICTHFIFRYFGRQDPLFHEVFLRALKHKPFYYG